MARLLVLDGHSAAALAFTRSAGRAGHWVAVGANRGIFAPASLSRYCQLGFEYPVSTDNAAEFCAAVLEFSRDRKIDLIIPITDWTSLPLARARACFERFCRLALPPQEALETASDKYRTIQMARTLNIPVPETWIIHSVVDLNQVPGLTYPVVVKDRYSVRWQNDKAVFGKVRYAYSRADLVEQVEERLEAVCDVLVQRFTGGTGIGFSCFALGDEVFLPFQWQRIREVDPRGSASSCRKSVAVEAEILEHSRRLIAQVGFQGIAMVEYKKEPESGRPILMEINGRPWGSIQLPIASGLDYPRYFVNWFLEGTPPPQMRYRQGIVSRRMVSELAHLDNLRGGKPQGWPMRYPSFWFSLVKIAIPWYPGVRYDDLSWDDPRPGTAGIVNWFRKRLKATVPAD